MSNVIPATILVLSISDIVSDPKLLTYTIFVSRLRDTVTGKLPTLISSTTGFVEPSIAENVLKL